MAVALDHPDEDVRRFACEHLLNFEPADALVAAAGHGDALVRSYVGRALRRRKIEDTYYDYGYYDPSVNRLSSNTPVIGERERAVLTRLAQDADAAVRLEAVRSLAERPFDLVDEELWRRLAGDAEAAVRAESVGLRLADPRADAAVLELFAANGDAEVLRAVDRRLADVVDVEFDHGRRMEPYLNVLALRRANRAHPLRSVADSGTVRGLFAAAVRSDAGIERVAAWAIEEQDDDLIALLAEEAPWTASQSFGSNVGMGCLDDEHFAAVFARVFELARDVFARAWEGSRQMQPLRASAFRRILVDESQPRTLRSYAAWGAAPVGGADYRSEVLDFLREPGGSVGRDGVPLHMIAMDMGHADRRAFLLAVASDTAIPDAVGLSVFKRVARERPFDAEVAAAVVRRWYGEERSPEVVSRALLHLDTAPGEDLSQLLIQAVRHPHYYERAIATLGRLGHEEYLQTLGTCLRADWPQDEGHRANVQNAAVDALRGYLTDEAAGYLLEGLGWIRDDYVREQCYESLKTMRIYQEERERWSARKANRQARERAVLELVAMTEAEDPDVRANAVRSLATIGAVEHLPRMVRLLADDHPMVRDAAQKALESIDRADPLDRVEAEEP